ncbi:MAG: DUF1848 domain-containing protein [Spirochaetaceae bacterium]|nr:DUF1848 domain-containing protein [Spirochaetaceae bacterium]
MIVSVSRRNDIPRFHFRWFLEKLEQGFVDVANPFNRNQIRRVSLLPSDAEILVFWTRDPSALLIYGKNLESLGYKWYCMTTLTAYPPQLEANPPEQALVLRGLHELSGRFGPERVLWRYDPLILSSLTTEDFHLANFKRLSGALKGAVRRVIVSGYDEYPRTRRRMEKLAAGEAFTMPPLRDQEGRFLPPAQSLLKKLAELAREAGMTMQSCAEKEDLSPLGISQGACIDRDLIKTLWNIEIPGKANQRKHCRCAPSVDIGSYGACPALCAYCYAR